MAKPKKELNEKEIKYIKNELACIKLRLRQMENYRKKISTLIDEGKTIEDVEKEFGNVEFKTMNKVKL